MGGGFFFLFFFFKVRVRRVDKKKLIDEKEQSRFMLGLGRPLIWETWAAVWGWGWRHRNVTQGGREDAGLGLGKYKKMGHRFGCGECLDPNWELEVSYERWEDHGGRVVLLKTMLLLCSTEAGSNPLLTRSENLATDTFPISYCVTIWG